MILESAKLIYLNFQPLRDVAFPTCYLGLFTHVLYSILFYVRTPGQAPFCFSLLLFHSRDRTTYLYRDPILLDRDNSVLAE